ncbi:hypothetical protein BV20DRAFT_988713 [Pilatotrama ljubarskyi]|nr:hypothetical protein BV20DRAFT_988713 [Pilatotrama ljubarskyi]
MASSADESRSRARDIPQLVESLNELLGNLGMELPFPLETPFDLTPSLLLGILESILETRLPISVAIRASRDFASKVQAMKIFLGVFESDVLGGLDVGLSDVDPRRLAAGEEEEVVFVGELLCWLGRQRGLLSSSAGPSRKEDVPPSLSLHARRGPASPSTHSTMTSGLHSNLSMGRTVLADTDTTVMSVASEPLAPLAHAELPDLPSLPPAPDHAENVSRSTSIRQQPRCIHEVEDPSFLDAEADRSISDGSSICHCASSDAEEGLPETSNTALPVRRSGLISSANEKSELDLYYGRRTPASPPATVSRRANSYSGFSSSPLSGTGERGRGDPPRRIITPHNAPTQYTLALLNERARLLDELAKLKAASLVK